VRVLFDQGTPVPLRDSLQQHEVSTAFERGWSELKNGELLDAAEREGFAVLVTTDTKLKFQQNLSGRRIAIVASLTTSWPRIERTTAEVVKAIVGCHARQLHGSQYPVRKTANPRFDPTRSGGLRPPTRAGQPQRWASYDMSY
jgi:predicted nuclease of predicted toxin-antitoxin system